MAQDSPPSANSDFWTFLAAGIGYWFVALTALLAGCFYSDRGWVAHHQASLAVLGLLMLPFYIVYAGVFDPERSEAFSAEAAPQPRATSVADYLVQRYFRGALNVTIWLVCVAMWFGVTAILILLNDKRLPAIGETWGELSGIQIRYAVALLLCHAYYAIWLWRRRDSSEISVVRYETFLPVLIISFSFFLGATVFEEAITDWILAVPVFIFLVYCTLHFLAQWWGPISPRWFARSTVVILLLAVLLPLCLARLNYVQAATGADWAGTLLVAFSVGLYLSLYELWKLTALAIRRAERNSIWAQSRKSYYEATLVSHGAGLVAVPLMYLFGDFGLVFLLASFCHAILGFCIWYATGGPSYVENAGEGLQQAGGRGSLRNWRVGKLTMGFLFLLLVFWGVGVNEPFNLEKDYFPREVTGLSASVLAAIFLAIMATPFVQFLADAEAQAPNRFRRLIRQFFSLPERTAVFRLAAVLSGVMLVFTMVLYEIAYSEKWNVTGRSSRAFWVYVVLTVVLGLITLFAPSRQRSQPRGPSGSAAHAAVLTLIGSLQTLRVGTGLIAFLAVALVGLSAQGARHHVIQMAFAVSLVVMASFAINDCYDRIKDEINAPHRAVPSGKLTESQALGLGLGALMIGVVLGLAVVEGLGSAIFLAGAFGGATYNEFVRRFPSLKGVVTAFLCALLVAFDLIVFELPRLLYWVCAACFIFALGRELLMDVRDRRGDEKFGLITLATRLGDRLAGKLAFAFVFASAVPLAAYVALGEKGFLGWSILSTYLLAIATATRAWYFGQAAARRNQAIGYLRVCLLAGAVLMAF